jgi:hypothetical protein
MLPQGEQTHITENFVSTPPALFIKDERGDVWALGLQQVPGPRGEFAFPVVRNGIELGEFASRIERRNGKIRVFTLNGWKQWTGRTFI